MMCCSAGDKSERVSCPPPDSDCLLLLCRELHMYLRHSFFREGGAFIGDRVPYPSMEGALERLGVSGLTYRYVRHSLRRPARRGTLARFLYFRRQTTV